MPNKQQPDENTYSYSEWRKSLKFTVEQEENYKMFISTNCRECTWEDVLEKLHRCLKSNILPSHLVVGLLYSSYHIVSPHTIPMIEYLIEHSGDTLDMTVTSISNPRCMIPHVAASGGSHKLLCMYYQHGWLYFRVGREKGKGNKLQWNKHMTITFSIGGDINVADSRNLTAFHISAGNHFYHCVNVLLWQNVSISFGTVTNHLKGVPVEKLCSLLHELMTFVNDVDTCRSLLSELCSHLPQDCVDIIAEYSLPLKARKDVLTLFNTVEKQRAKEWKDIETTFSELATEEQDVSLKRKRIDLIGFGGKPDLWTAFYPTNLANRKNRSWNATDDSFDPIKDYFTSENFLVVAGISVLTFFAWRSYK
ncbi:hypothetical protein RFI_20965 [Reticulomyxa filosa]|uniref:Uncharacterized protein n=1 Tax=Reticulomyxa filosa TaxID=46433 RepID=X6MQY9_RETFI|nr:hypothetical protein RFI_20965 [Reticulomyxa filosa]|eukprot:ETO16383.1 hypothetical protein RFI_20965 [Reticulomyxa filosa]